MDRADPQLIVLADAPEALLEVGGITLLERILRISQRLGFTQALVLSTTPEAIRGELARPSWARAAFWVDVATRPNSPLTVQAIRQTLTTTAAHTLVIPANIFCDARLLQALLERNANAVLIDSGGLAPGQLAGPFLVSARFLESLASSTLIDQLQSAMETGKIATVDAAKEPSYIVGMRRQVRPVCQMVSPEQRECVEKIVFRNAQNGTLDLPAYLHAPIETWIISRLCRTTVTPNQITLFGFGLGLVATALFASAHFGLGILIALIFGVLDGLDGKQARVKVETTPRGEWEHVLDLVLEYSWWMALAFGLHRSGQLPGAFFFLALLLGADLVDREAKRRAKLSTGRLLDDVAPFDRAFRLLSGRRNIYVWLLAGGFWLGKGPGAYQTMAVWAGCSAAVHVGRAVRLAGRRDRSA